MMEERDLENWIDLYRVLTRKGNSVSRQQIMNYVRGYSEAPCDFVRGVAAALELTEDEKWEIAYSWAYEQRIGDQHCFRTDI